MKDGKYIRKTWKQMKAQYGLNCNGNINCKCIFTKEMEYLPLIIDVKNDFIEGFLISEDMVVARIDNAEEEKKISIDITINGTKINVDENLAHKIKELFDA